MRIIENGLRNLLVWAVAKRGRIPKVIAAAAVAAVALVIVPQAIYAAWYNSQVLPGLRAEYAAEQAARAEADAAAAAEAERVKHGEGSRLEPPTVDGVLKPPAAVVAPQPAPTPDTAGETTDADPSEDAEQPTLLPSASGWDDDDQDELEEAAQDTADKFIAAYAAGDEDEASRYMPEAAAAGMRDAGLEPVEGVKDVEPATVTVMGTIATAVADMGHITLSVTLTLDPDGESWTVASYSATGRE